MDFYFTDKTYEELREYIEKKALIIVPVGTVEEHGKHLPVGTDFMVAEDLSREIGVSMQRKGDVPFLITPAIWTGYSTKEMARWPGTIRVRSRIVMDMIFDVCSSLIDMGFQKIILFNCHGHHNGLLRTVCREISDAHDVYVAMVNCSSMLGKEFKSFRKSKPGGAVHGGEYETSIMLYFKRPVCKDKYTKEDIVEYESDFFSNDNFEKGSKVFWSTWGVQRSKTGIYGDPSASSEETGRKIVEITVRNFTAFAEEFYKKG